MTDYTPERGCARGMLIVVLIVMALVVAGVRGWIGG